MGKALDIVDLLNLAVERGASDLVITVGLPPMVKVDGEFHPTEFEPLTPQETRRLTYALMDEKQQRVFEEDKELDFSFSLPGKGRFRVNVFLQRGSVGGVLRVVPSSVKSFEELGLPKSVASIALSPRGLVLVTGPTGSGKSTTLASMIDFINQEKRCHIVTIEDPIEFFHRHKRSIINQREIGADTHSFSKALRAVLRQAPDVILVGRCATTKPLRQPSRRLRPATWSWAPYTPTALLRPLTVLLTCFQSHNKNRFGCSFPTTWWRY
jgi:twitching motility protein PilT